MMTNSDKSKKAVSTSNAGRKKNLRDQSATDKAGQAKPKPLTLAGAEKLLKKHGLGLDIKKQGKRIYRKKDDLNDQSKGPKEEVNRLAKPIPVRVYSKHHEMFNACAPAFSTKREAMEKAIELLAHSLETNDLK